MKFHISSNDQMTKNDHQNKNEWNIFPHLQKKYRVILLLLGILAILLPSYLGGWSLWISYLLLADLGLATFGLYQNFRFQRFYKKLRPFIVARILQIEACIGMVALLAITVQECLNKQAWIPYGILWLLAVATVYQYFAIFRLAKQTKEKYPDRCEFC